MMSSEEEGLIAPGHCKNKLHNHIFRSKFFLVSVAFGIIQVILFSWQADQRHRIDKLQEYAIKKVFNNTTKWGMNYEVVFNYVESRDKLNTELNEFIDITLVTQCSVNNLRYLPLLAKNWKGPISVAVFTPQEDAIQAILGVRWLKHCYPTLLGKQTTFHFVYPRKFPPRTRHHSINPDFWDKTIENSKKFEFNCHLAMDAIEHIEGTNYMAGKVPYPHNTLRNVAKRAVNTKFMFLIDIDTVPSKYIHQNFIKFYDKLETHEKDKAVFVTPAFELKHGEKLPSSKSRLIQEYNYGNVRPFHHETCIWCHKPTRFQDWLAIPESDSMGIAYEGEWAPSWEPFYISITDIPEYDERFQQYGYDRISQVCELSMAGYKFNILNNAFVVHEGFKIPGKFHSQKDVENKRNFRIYTNLFTPEMKSKYPNSTTSCQERNRVRGKAQVQFNPHFQAHLKRKQETTQSSEEL